MTHGVRQYRKKLKKELRCCCSARRRLLDQWDSSLAGFLEDHPDPAVEEISAAFGPPEEMAQILMAELTTEDTRQYRLHIRIKRVLAGLCAAAFLLFFAYVFFEKQKPITVIETGEFIETSDSNKGE